jgi:hypothetical protein
LEKRDFSGNQKLICLMLCINGFHDNKIWSDICTAPVATGCNLNAARSLPLASKGRRKSFRHALAEKVYSGKKSTTQKLSFSKRKNKKGK